MTILKSSRFSGPIQLVRSAKHACFVGQKRARWFLHDVQTGISSRFWASHNERVAYRYQPGMYRRSFLNWDSEAPTTTDEVPSRIFCLWTGDNPLSVQRLKSLERMRKMHCDVPIVLVTHENLNEWVLPDHPIHPAYQNLSLVHRSDYLRAYLLHHHGGAYADIKTPLHSWAALFELFSDEDLWFAGYPERSTQWVAHLPRDLGRDLRHYYRIVPGGCSFIVRPHTHLSHEWLSEVERRLDYFAPLLEQNPGGIRNEVGAYPIGWNDLLAKIVHPLALKHHTHVRMNDRLLPKLENYQ